MDDYDDEYRPLSKSALWALICGISTLGLMVAVFVIKGTLRSPVLAWSLIILQVYLGLTAIALGRAGITRISQARGIRGRPLAVTGVVMGYAQLAFLMVLLPAIDVTQYMENMQDAARKHVQEVGVASARAACDLTLGEVIMNGGDFSCADAQRSFVPPGGLTISIETNGPNSCLIKAVADGSGTPTTEVWYYTP